MTDQIQKDPTLRQGSGFWVLVWDRLLDTFDKVIGQCFSGRWILTVAAAVIMVKTCWSHPEKVLEFKEIIAVIIYAYFNKPPEKEQDNKTTTISAPKDTAVSVNQTPAEAKDGKIS